MVIPLRAENVAWLGKVRFPASVAVHNLRLAILLRLLQAAIIVALVYAVFISRIWISLEEPVGYVTKWVDQDAAEYDAAVQSDFAKPFCTDPTAFDYVYNDAWKYRGYECTEMPAFDRFRKEGDDLVYIPLSFRERQYKLRPAPAGASASSPCAGLAESCHGGWRPLRMARAGSSASVACECRSEANYYLVGQGSLNISLEHFYTMKRLEGTITSKQHSGKSCVLPGFVCSTRAQHELLTLILITRTQADGSEVEERLMPSVLSPSDISFSVGEVLRRADVPLDGFNRQTLQNKLRCGTANSGIANCSDDANMYPLLRQTGVEIHIALHYYNALYRERHKQFAEFMDHLGPSCVVSIRVTPKWTSRPASVDCSSPTVVSDRQADCVNRYFYGAQVSFSAKGLFGFFDVFKLILALGSISTYTALPIWIVYFIATHLLGPVSKMYKRVTERQLRIDDELVTLAVKAIGTSVAFETLAQQKGVIPRDVMLRELLRAFAEMPDFGIKDQARLAELIWERIKGISGEDAISLAEFVRSCDRSGLQESIQPMFDMARTRWPLERFLAPSSQMQADSQVFPRRRAKSGGDFDEDALNALCGLRGLTAKAMPKVIRVVPAASGSNEEAQER